jgi:hypothetical protein
MLTRAKQRDRRPRDDLAGPAWLQALFPAPPARADVPARSPGVSAALLAGKVALNIVAVAAGTVVMLARIPGRPALDTIYNEDLTVYLVDALSRPWHLFIVYGGYVQLMPRLIGQLAAALPLHLAATVFSLTGALTAAACAVVVFHATAGHIRSVALRALAGAAVLFLPVGTLEIANSTVGAPWYLLLPLFWATLWRPRTGAGMAAAAVIALLASTSVPLTLLFAPLLAARLVVLRRLRDHAVTIGWAVGLLMQLPFILKADSSHQSRLNALAPIHDALSFYAHGVVQSALGWHIGWRVQSAAGHTGAVAIVGGVFVAFFAWALITSPLPTRLLIAVTLLTGFVFTVISADVGYRFAGIGRAVSVHHEAGSRYATLGIFLFDCAAIVAVDALIQRSRTSRQRDPHDLDNLQPRTREWPRQAAPALALLLVLSAGWVMDYRFNTPRSLGSARPWATVLAQWEHECAANPAGRFQVTTWDLPKRVKESIPCSRIRP